MRKEILRMERVTYKEADMIELEDFNLQIYEGEIMGLLPFNGQGMVALLKLLQVNLPLYDGYIYYNGEQINSWRESSGTHNRIGVIQEKSSLVESMTIADNVFVLRHGFKQEFIQEELLKSTASAFSEGNRYGNASRYNSRQTDSISTRHRGAASFRSCRKSSGCSGRNRSIDQ